MNEHHECESDEDCEVYFLKPVNEYNIVDKIKEANKELFAADTDTEGADDGDIESKQANRKVTFALNLEDYEPEGTTDEIGKTNLSEESEVVDDLQLKLLADYKFPVIDEEEETTEETLIEESEDQARVEEESVSPKALTKMAKMPSSTSEDEEERSTSKSDEIDKDDVVEEICEEIIVMDMESGKMPQEDTISISHRHMMMKQATFDYEEQDNNSLTNLLPSDCDDEEEPIEDDDDDDDDNLSIIVASYMPDDEFDNASLNSDNDQTERLFSNRKSPKFRRIPFSKRFSFRRKGGNSSNSIGACTNTRKHVPPAGVTDLKLNYKTCCEYRHSVLDQLPKYTGYLSEYGLSREQLERRQEKQHVKQRFVLEQTLKANEQDMRKMQDNERAFTTWLKNKMRFPINKTRNMFDVKMGNRNRNGKCN